MSVKEIALDTIRGLPEDASWQDIDDRLRYIAAVEKGMDDIRNGRVVAHEEVKRQLKQWITG